MGTILSHTTALFIHAKMAESARLLPRGHAAVKPDAPRADAAALARRAFSLEGIPIDILVVDRPSRRNLAGTRTHLCTRPLPRWAICPLGDGLHVASPELCFAQLAPQLPFIDLLLLGCELLGTYGLRLSGLNDGLLDLPRPLMDLERLDALLHALGPVHGAAMAGRARKRLLAGSGSPEETKLGLAMTLPRSLGGQGAGGAQLNHEIRLTPQQRRQAGRGSYRIDILYEREGIGFEYLGEAAHSGMLRGVEDLRRESIIQSREIQVHGVTKSQARNSLELSRFAAMVYRARGMQYRKPTSEQFAKMNGLLGYLHRDSARVGYARFHALESAHPGNMNDTVKVRGLTSS